MSDFLLQLEHILSVVADGIWGYPLIILLFGTHIFLTFRLKFIQRYIFKGIKLSFSRSQEGSGDISQFGALTTALASTIGTGNIVGVATAIAMGGPGAVLWMWLTGVFGIATKYAEAVLSIKYRVRTEDGTMAGGPMYVLERGLNKKWLGVIFAALTALSAFGIGNMVQANSISEMVRSTFNIENWITGIVITILTAFVILGGIRKIAHVCEMLVPFMAAFYMLGCIIILGANISTLPDTIALIFESAFS
ncbi:partial Amino-acid carrier protein AlsT, partial [uncultured bacterium]